MDSQKLIAENDDDLDILLLNDHTSCWAGVMASLRRVFIPTSLKQALEAQQKLLKTFVTSSVQHKRFSLSGGGECLNYVDIRGAGQEYCSSHRDEATRGGAAMGGGGSTKPTLVLMHGFGSGEYVRVFLTIRAAVLLSLYLSYR
jgi:hypothetical protein